MDLLNTGIKALAKETKATDNLYRIVANTNGYRGYIYKGKIYKSDVFNLQWVIINASKALPPKDEVYNVRLIEPSPNRKQLYNV